MSEISYTSGEQLFTVIEDVLDFANEEKAVEGDTVNAPVSVNDLIQTGLDKIQIKAVKRGIDIIYTPQSSDSFIVGDAEKLNKVFSNIIENAEKFNKDRGFIKIGVDFHDDNTAKIDIIDTGIGIAAEDIERIMAPFVQVDDSYSRSYGGSGLGLSIADRWTKFFGGEIKIFSKPNKGTCVRIIIPAQREKDLVKPFPVSANLETAA